MKLNLALWAVCACTVVSCELGAGKYGVDVGQTRSLCGPSVGPGSMPAAVLLFQRGAQLVGVRVPVGTPFLVPAIPGRAYPGPASPDGRMLSVVTETGVGDATRQALWVVPLDGSPARALGVEGRRVRSPAWLPTSDALVVEWDKRDFSDVYRVPLAGGGAPLRLTASENGSFDPAISPDGTQLAFASSRDGNAEIYVQGLASGVVTRLTHHPADDTRPAWLSDSRLAWIAYREGSAGLWAVDLPGGSLAQLVVRTGVQSMRPGAPSSGDVVAFAVAPGRDRIAVTVVHDDVGILVVDAQSGAQLASIGGAKADDTPAWSPDGQWLAWTRGTDPEVWLARWDGTAPCRVADGWLPRWAINLP